MNEYDWKDLPNSPVIRLQSVGIRSIFIDDLAVSNAF